PRLARHEISRISEEELRQLLTGLRQDELVQLVAIHRAHLPDELDGELPLAFRVDAWPRPCHVPSYGGRCGALRQPRRFDIRAGGWRSLTGQHPEEREVHG